MCYRYSNTFFYISDTAKFSEFENIKPSLNFAIESDAKTTDAGGLSRPYISRRVVKFPPLCHRNKIIGFLKTSFLFYAVVLLVCCL
jgi:hypothetical protein